MEHLFSPEWIISCEHAGNLIPEQYEQYFWDADKILKSHRGWDPGAFQLAEFLSRKTGAQLFSYPYTRLFIDTNRSIGNPKLFSEFSRILINTEKQKVIEAYYLPYRNEVTESIRQKLKQKGTVIHISIHSFTPVLNGKKRDFEIGLLYDPSRILEKNVSRLWKSIIHKSYPDLRVRMNQPYKGVSDGFTTCLRKVFDLKSYLGIELEINQQLVFQKEAEWIHACSKLAETLSHLQKQLN